MLNYQNPPKKIKEGSLQNSLKFVLEISGVVDSQWHSCALPAVHCTACSQIVAFFGTIYIMSHFHFLLSSSFFPGLISAVADWMSTILLHMVWP